MATSAGQQPVTWVPWREPWAWLGSAGSINLIAMHRVLRYFHDECQGWQPREMGGKGTKQGQNDRKTTQGFYFLKTCASVPQDGSIQGSARTSEQRGVLGGEGLWAGWGSGCPELGGGTSNSQIPLPMWVTTTPTNLLTSCLTMSGRSGWRGGFAAPQHLSLPGRGGGCTALWPPKMGKPPGEAQGALIAEQGS